MSDWQDFSASYIDPAGNGNEYDIRAIKGVVDPVNKMFYILVLFHRDLFSNPALGNNQHYTQLFLDFDGDHTLEYRINFWNGLDKTRDWTALFRYEKKDGEPIKTHIKQTSILMQAGSNFVEGAIPLDLIKGRTEFELHANGAQDAMASPRWIIIRAHNSFNKHPGKIWHPNYWYDP